MFLEGLPACRFQAVVLGTALWESPPTYDPYMYADIFRFKEPSVFAVSPNLLKVRVHAEQSLRLHFTSLVASPRSNEEGTIRKSFHSAAVMRQLPESEDSAS